MVVMPALPISIVVSGKNEPHGKYLSSRTDLDAELWTHIPLYNWLKDPIKEEQVKWHQDCTHDLTVTSLYSQAAFPTTCCYICDLVEQKQVGQCLDFQCISGYHRASTTGATCAEMLNALVDEGGNRKYNVQVFSLLDYTKPRSLANQVDQAIVWATQTDCKYLMPGGPAIESKDRFGFKACMQREASRASFADIWEYVDDLNAPYFGTLQAVTHEFAHEEVHTPPMEPPLVPHPPLVPPPPPPVRRTQDVVPPWKRAKTVATSTGATFHMETLSHRRGWLLEMSTLG